MIDGRIGADRTPHRLAGRLALLVEQEGTLTHSNITIQRAPIESDFSTPIRRRPNSGYVVVNDSDLYNHTHRARAGAQLHVAHRDLDTLTRLSMSGAYDVLALQLHPGVEPDAALRGLLAGLAPTARLDSHLTVLPPDRLDILSAGSVLRDHDAAITEDDDRFAATALCAGVETATTIVLPSVP